VRFNTSKADRWETDSQRCHVNWVILDSDWEAEFCRVAEFAEVYAIQSDFAARVEHEFNRMVQSVSGASGESGALSRRAP
jgi:hypothetical protein